MPDSAAQMSPAQLNALAGGDIEDLVAPQSRTQANPAVRFEAGRADPVFDSAFHAETRRPLLQSSTMQSAVYTSQAWFEAEQNMLQSSWTLVGRVDEVPESGDFLTVDAVGLGPVAVVRGHKADQLHAFANVCCHRGAQVISGESGSATKVGFICPYHAWTYDLDGKLKWAPGTDELDNFDPDADHMRMQPVRIETFCGFIFVCADPDVAPLRERLGDLPHHLPEWFAEDSGAANDMIAVGRAEYTVDCNWKFVFENT